MTDHLDEVATRQTMQAWSDAPTEDRDVNRLYTRAYAAVMHGVCADVNYGGVSKDDALDIAADYFRAAGTRAFDDGPADAPTGDEPSFHGLGDEHGWRDKYEAVYAANVHLATKLAEVRADLDELEQWADNELVTDDGFAGECVRTVVRGLLRIVNKGVDRG